MCLRFGALHPTGRIESKGGPTVTVGSPGVSLHSRRYPYEPPLRPLPLTETTCAWLRPEDLLRVNAAAPKAGPAVAITRPPARRPIATNRSPT